MLEVEKGKEQETEEAEHDTLGATSALEKLCVSAIPALWRQRQEHHKFKVVPGYLRFDFEQQTLKSKGTFDSSTSATHPSSCSDISFVF